MAVTFKAKGAFTFNTKGITVPYPTGGDAPVENDIAILVLESENEEISLTTANGFVELGDQANKAAGTPDQNPASRLAIYWKRCTGSDANPVVADSGDHTTGQIYLFSGCITSGNPWDVYAEGNDSGQNDTSGVVPGSTTTEDDCLILLICTTSLNSTSQAEFDNWTNSDLGSLTEIGDDCNGAGLGGGHGFATGTKASAGSYGNTTVTLANTSYKGAMSIALKPPPSGTTYYKTLPATEVAVAGLSRLSTYYRTLTISEVANLSITTLGTWYRTLAGVAGSTPSVFKEMYVTLSSTEVSVATLTKCKMFQKLLEAVETAVATLGTEKIIGRILDATATTVAGITKALTCYRTLDVTATTVPDIARLVSYFRTLPVTSVSVLSLIKKIPKTLSVTETSIATFTLLRFQTMLATAVSVAGMATQFIAGGAKKMVRKTINLLFRRYYI